VLEWFARSCRLALTTEQDAGPELGSQRERSEASDTSGVFRALHTLLRSCHYETFLIK